MKITAVRTVPVWCPRRRAYGGVTRTALGPAAVSDYAIVFVDTDAGITGLGEVCASSSGAARLLHHDLEAGARTRRDRRGSVPHRVSRSEDGPGAGRRRGGEGGNRDGLVGHLGQGAQDAGLQPPRRQGARPHSAELLGAVRRAGGDGRLSRSSASARATARSRSRSATIPARDIDAVPPGARGDRAGDRRCGSTATWAGRRRSTRSA